MVLWYLSHLCTKTAAVFSKRLFRRRRPYPQFLVASLCLFMIEDDVAAEQRGLDLFKFAAPPGVRSQVCV